jgi:hypothetical protein
MPHNCSVITVPSQMSRYGSSVIKTCLHWLIWVTYPLNSGLNQNLCLHRGLSFQLNSAETVPTKQTNNPRDNKWKNWECGFLHRWFSCVAVIESNKRESFYFSWIKMLMNWLHQNMSFNSDQCKHAHSAALESKCQLITVKHGFRFYLWSCD